MKKRTLSAMLALLIMLSLMLPACAKNNSTETTEEPTMDIYQKSDPAQDDTLNILMIGSSFCYYYVEELHGMLDATGIKAKVCNVYYSGCPLEKHWTWWKSGEANYDFYVTDENGRVGTKGVNLEYCLAQENWDVISLQESTSKIYNEGAQEHLESTKQYWSELMDYLMQQFPASRFLWHQPWTLQVDYGREGHPMTPELQDKNEKEIEDFAISLCDYYKGKVQRVNSGRAWQICRTKYGYDYLTCRIKKNNGEGDGYHDGDIGGGQYLNACVWYEIITGKSCLNNTYRPAYEATVILSDELNSKIKVNLDGTDFKLNDEMISILQNSAHEAVAQLGITIAD